MEIALVLGLLVVGIALFSTEVVSVDVVTLTLLVALIVFGILSPAEAFAGFGSELIITLVSIFVLSGALQQSGVIAEFAAWLERVARGRRNPLLLLLLGSTGGLSTMINNTTATAVFMPAGLQIAHRLEIAPSKVLMPLAFASILGGTCTLIGTSTNLAVSGYLEAAGLEPMGLFELAPVGLVVLPIGIAYLLTVGRRLLPDHREESLTAAYEMREYLSEVVVTEGSPLVGERVYTSALADLGFRVLEVRRDGRFFLPAPDTELAAGDLLIVQGPVQDLLQVKAKTGLEIRGDLLVDDKVLQQADIEIAEALVPPQSSLIGRTVRESRFRQRHGVTVLALHRGGQHPPRGTIGQLRLRLGDVLLVQGPAARLESLRRGRDLWLIERSEPVSVPRRRRGIATLVFLAAAAVGAGLGVVPLAIAFLGAALGTVLIRAITVDEAYRFVEWRLIVLIGGMTAFGTAMESTGAADLLARGIVAALADLGPHAVLGGFALLTIALTQPMSNAAAALVVLPVALSTATGLDVSGRPFAMAIALAASLSFITPLEPSSLLVYGPGKYRFRDFAIVGGPLTLLLLAVVLFLVPRVWPF